MTQMLSSKKSLHTINDLDSSIGPFGPKLHLIRLGEAALGKRAATCPLLLVLPHGLDLWSLPSHPRPRIPRRRVLPFSDALQSSVPLEPH